jgi:hypothetical protein
MDASAEMVSLSVHLYYSKQRLVGVLTPESEANDQIPLPAVMATSDNFRPRSSLGEFPERKSVAGIDNAGRLGS